MTSFIILPIFFNPDALDESEDLYAITDKGEPAREQWVRFFCPSRPEYRAKTIASIVKHIAELDPGGLSLDFIRTFVFWEQVYPNRTLSSLSSLPTTCFDSSCLARFQADTRISIPDSLASTADIAEWLCATSVGSGIPCELS